MSVCSAVLRHALAMALAPARLPLAWRVGKQSARNRRARGELLWTMANLPEMEAAAVALEYHLAVDEAKNLSKLFSKEQTRRVMFDEGWLPRDGVVLDRVLTGVYGR